MRKNFDFVELPMTVEPFLPKVATNMVVRRELLRLAHSAEQIRQIAKDLIELACLYDEEKEFPENQRSLNIKAEYRRENWGQVAKQLMNEICTVAEELKR